jgi:hypothetical protein
MSRTLALLALAILLACPAAAAHGGGGDQGYRSTPNGTRPHLPGLYMSVHDSDDRLWVKNETGHTVTVLGYRAEPYLRFGPDGIYRNTRSPATYLNEDRYANVALPATADPRAAPDWAKVAGGDAWEWHDHRIHWMSTIPPAPVRAAPRRPHHVFDWRIPIETDGKRYAIVGSLDYTPPPPGTSSLLPSVLAFAAGFAALSSVAFLLWRRRNASGRGARDER